MALPWNLWTNVADLEPRVDDLERTTQSHDCDLETLKEENLILQLEDFENRSRSSSLYIHSLPESIQDLH